MYYFSIQTAVNLFCPTLCTCQNLASYILKICLAFIHLHFTRIMIFKKLMFYHWQQILTVLFHSCFVPEMSVRCLQLNTHCLSVLSISCSTKNSNWWACNSETKWFPQDNRCTPLISANTLCILSILWHQELKLNNIFYYLIKDILERAFFSHLDVCGSEKCNNYWYVLTIIAFAPLVQMSTEYKRQITSNILKWFWLFESERIVRTGPQGRTAYTSATSGID